jgi:serine/threonine-protein kinase RsbW
MVELRLNSELGSERTAMAVVASVAQHMGFPRERVEDIKTAVSEATLNAIEHGNALDPRRPVSVLVVPSGRKLEVSVRDRSARPCAWVLDPPQPSLADKLQGLATTRGWGIFLIRSLMDEVEFSSTRAGNQVRMVVYHDPALQGGEGAGHAGGGQAERPV